MLLIMGVTLYTSRVILENLGVEDFGIYNVVGGLASSFIFFSSSLSNATQRFLNFELGKSNISKANDIFNQSILIYSLISIVVIIVAEIVGPWFITNKLVIPPERLNAALIVFQVTVISFILSLIGTVFDSVLIARENMKIYAYIGVFESIAKLAIVYLLSLAPVDKLELYAILLLLVQIVVKLLPLLFCLKHYPECKFRYYWNKDLFVSMGKFIGWNGFGTAVWMINEQGLNILLNIFFGPIVNAARAVSNQVGAAVNNFTANFFVAVRPQIIMSYSSGNIKHFLELIFKSSKYSFFLIWIISLPMMFRINYILILWLKTPPEYTSEFVIWIIIYHIINVLTNPTWSAIQAIGDLKKYVVIGSTVYLMAFPISYIFLKLGFSPVAPFQTLAFVRLVYLFVVLEVLKRYVSFSIILYFKEVLLPIVLVATFSVIPIYFVNGMFKQDFVSVASFVILSVVINAFVIMFIGMTKGERDVIVQKIKKKKNNNVKVEGC